MLEVVTIICIIIFYISLFVELYFYSIPSIVSTKKILKPDQSIIDHFSENIKNLLSWSLSIKLLVFVVPMIFIYILHLLPAYILYDLIFNEEQLQSTYWICWMGIVLVIFGRIISHIYLNDIKKIKTKAFTGFITSGLFKFSRNPGLLGLYISFLGFYALKPSTLFLICYVIYIIHMHFKIMMEENYLTNKHGEDYKEYLKTTKRYL